MDELVVPMVAIVGN